MNEFLRWVNSKTFYFLIKKCSLLPLSSADSPESERWRTLFSATLFPIIYFTSCFFFKSIIQTIIFLIVFPHFSTSLSLSTSGKGKFHSYFDLLISCARHCVWFINNYTNTLGKNFTLVSLGFRSLALICLTIKVEPALQYDCNCSALNRSTGI